MGKKRILRRLVFFPWHKRKKRLRKMPPPVKKADIKQEVNTQKPTPLAYIPKELDPYSKMLQGLPQILTALPGLIPPQAIETPTKVKYAWGQDVHHSYQHPRFGCPLPVTSVTPDSVPL